MHKKIVLKCEKKYMVFQGYFLNKLVDISMKEKKNLTVNVTAYRTAF